MRPRFFVSRPRQLPRHDRPQTGDFRHRFRSHLGCHCRTNYVGYELSNVANSPNSDQTACNEGVHGCFAQYLVLGVVGAALRLRVPALGYSPPVCGTPASATRQQRRGFLHER